jgi:hypothetical protein
MRPDVKSSVLQRIEDLQIIRLPENNLDNRYPSTVTELLRCKC